MADGLLGKCKACAKADVRNHRQKNLTRIRKYDEKRNRQPERMAAIAKTSARWRRAYPQRYRAQTAVNNAVRDGRVVKPKTCEACGKRKRLHGHHDDYAKPLEVRWLCVVCHAAAHQ